MPLTLLLAVAFQQAKLSPPLQSLVDAELHFAQDAKTRGTKEGFLAALAPDAVVFTPKATNGIEYWKTRPAGKGLLEWWPVRAEIASDKDFGYTTGPWRFSNGGTILARGTFLTAWSREGTGTWKVLADAGASHKDAYGDGVEPEGKELPKPSRTAAKLDANEEAFDREIDQAGVKNAYQAALTSDALVLLEGQSPIRGSARAVAALDAEGKPLKTHRDGFKVAASGDLGFTYGTLTGSDKKEYVYFRIWRGEQGKWRLVIERRGPTA